MSKELSNFLGVLRTGSIAAFALSCALPAQMSAQDNADEEAVEEVETFTITGSRISALDAEPIAPVISYSSQDIEDTGFTTVGDVLRSLSFNNGQSLTPTDAGTSFTPGVSTVNLRGLGNNQTLILVNGRRAAPYASAGFDGLQTVFDLNSIPVAAISEIEILKDGASAIYGSDAVGGVVNVKLRQDYQGMNVSLRVGDYFDTGGFYRQGSVTMGTSDARSSIIMVADWSQTDSVFARDLDYSANADKTSVAAEANPRWVVDNFEYYGYETEEAYIEDVLGGDPIELGEFDNRSVFGFPGWVWADSAALPKTANEPRQDPAASPDDLDNYFLTPYYNYQELNGLFPEERRFSFYTAGTYDITDWMTGYVEVSFSRAEAKVYAAPSLATTTEVGFSEQEPLTIPEENPFNPYDEDITFFGRRIVEAGNRINDVESDTPRLIAGLRGDLAGTETWEWDVYALYSKNTVTNITRNSITDERMQEALLGLTDLGGGVYSYDEATPAEERVYFNWFGTNDAAMANYLQVENPTVDTFELYVYEANVNGTLFELPGGDVGVAFGVERRIEELENVQTDLNQKQGLLAGGVGQTTYGERDVNAVYAEAQIPIIADMLEVQLAGRYEDYSDEGFSDDVRPKIGLRFSPLDWLEFKASYSESFKAPDLAYLYNSGVTTFTSNQYNDPLFPNDAAMQLQTRTSGNPDLSPETADIYFAGVTLAPTGALEGLLIKVEYFKLEQENLLAQLSDIYSYGEFLQGNLDGDPTFDGLVVRDPETQRILYLIDSYQNLQTAEQSSFDFTIQYRWQTEVAGEFIAGITSTWMESYEIEGTEYSGTYLTPEWNHNLRLSWIYGDWNATVFASYIDSRTRSIYQGTELYDSDTDPEGVEDDYWLVYDIQEQWTVNANVTFGGLFDTDITVGVNNIFNDTPPVDPLDHTGTTAGLNRLEPAFWYVRLEKNF